MSFGWTVMFREGQWLELRSFLLKQRINVNARASYLKKEIKKIGEVSIIYEREDPNDETTNMTERRKGIIVSQNSSLGKLMKAYVAKGGNPFDISMFLTPDRHIINELTDGDMVEIQTQPYDGVLHPMSDKKFFAVVSEAGLLPIWKDPYRKLGERKNIWDEKFSTDEVLIRLQNARSWASQEIKYFRNDIEARIIKLCDTREQLINEYTEILTQAVGDFSDAELDFDKEDFLVDRHLATIVNYFDEQFFVRNEEGDIDFTESVPPKIKIKLFRDMYLEDASDNSEDFTAL